MNIRQLQYFISVYNQKSFKNTSEAFSVSPQSVNKMIKMLEAELGEKLFLRKGNTITPTKEAEELFPRAFHLLEEFDAIETHYKHRRSKITICSIDSIMDFYLEDFVSDFCITHPELDLKILETTNDAAIENLRKKECDFAILQEPFSTSDIQNDFLFISPFVLLVNKKHPIAQKNIFTDKDFDQLPFAGRGSDYVIYDRTMKRLLAKNLHPIHVLESNNVRLLIRLVEDNIAIAAVNEAAARHYLTDNMKIMKFEDNSINDRISISYHSDLTPDQHLFIDSLTMWTHNHIAKGNNNLIQLDS